MVQDSMWHCREGSFRQLIKDIANKTLTVPEALWTYRELPYLPKDFKNMTIQELLSDPQQIESLYHALKKMPPERNFKLPYKKAERERELIELLAEDYDIDISKAQSKIVTGHYKDGIIAFNYCLEVAIAPFKDSDDTMAGKVDFIGNINSGMTIDGGLGYFSGGNFIWYDKKGNRLEASSVRGILYECGFSTNIAMAKRRFHSVVYMNLMTPIPDWVSGSGKTHIILNPYADLIAETVSSLAFKMPSYHGYGYTATIEYQGVKDENQIAQNYYLDFLKKRYAAIQADPSIKFTDRITQSGVWYRVHKDMVENGFKPRKDWGTTRESQTKLISDYCAYLSRTEWHKKVTREDLGIIASSRAIMYFNGHEYPVGKDNISALANAKTTDIIVIEKEGMADVLKEFADEYHIALVFTRGRFVDYVKELIEEAISEDVDIKVWTLTDYDVDGMEIANAVNREKVPRIGIDRNTVKWLQNNGYPDLKLEDVEEEHHAKDAEERTDDKYLWTKRIELDSIHTEVHGEGLWKYILHQITTMSKKGRDYSEIIARPHPSELFPKQVNEMIDYLCDLTDSLVDDEYKKMEESELKDVKNEILKIEDKRTANRKRLKEIISESEDMDTAIEEFQTLLEGGSLPEPKQEEGYTYVSEASLKRQKEQLDREKAESEIKLD